MSTCQILVQCVFQRIFNNLRFHSHIQANENRQAVVKLKVVAKSPRKDINKIVQYKETNFIILIMRNSTKMKINSTIFLYTFIVNLTAGV